MGYGNAKDQNLIYIRYPHRKSCQTWVSFTSLPTQRIGGIRFEAHTKYVLSLRAPRFFDITFAQNCVSVGWPVPRYAGGPCRAGAEIGLC